MSKQEWAFSRVHGRKLKRARLSRKLSQDSLAAMVHVTRNTIARWESGRTLLSLYHHSRLEQAMGTATGEL